MTLDPRDAPMVEVRRLGRRFAGTRALAGVDFEVPRGALVGLLGPNGAGKTTCMRILAGILAPTTGEARVDALDVSRDNAAVRQRVGYLPEGAPLYPELRVSEQLEFVARLRGLSRRQRREELPRGLERCGLVDVQRRIVGQLSKGYRQRVGLACALLGAPPLLLLDEPTSGLDPNQIRDVRELFRALVAEGTTIILSSHILAEVEALCETVLIIDRGQLVVQGPVSEVCAAGQGATVEVLGEAAAAESALAAVEAVDGISALPSPNAEAARFRLEGRFDDGAALVAVSSALQEAGLGLVELRRERAALESVFARLTQPPIPNAAVDDAPRSHDEDGAS